MTTEITNPQMSYKEYIALVKKTTQLIQNSMVRLKTNFIDWEHFKYTNEELVVELKKNLNHAETKLEEENINFLQLCENVLKVPNKSCEELEFADSYKNLQVVNSYVEESPQILVSPKLMLNSVYKYL